MAGMGPQLLALAAAALRNPRIYIYDAPPQCIFTQTTCYKDKRANMSNLGYGTEVDSIYDTYQFALPHILIHRLRELQTYCLWDADIAFVPVPGGPCHDARPGRPAEDHVYGLDFCSAWSRETIIYRSQMARFIPHLHVSANVGAFEPIPPYTTTPTTTTPTGFPSSILSSPTRQLPTRQKKTCPAIFVAGIEPSRIRQSKHDCVEHMIAPYPSAWHFHRNIPEPVPWNRRYVNVSYAGSFRGNTLGTNMTHALRMGVQMLHDSKQLIWLKVVPSPDATFGRACARLYMQSKYCLIPPGDSPTRKAFYDAVGAGCIPIIMKQSLGFYSSLQKRSGLKPFFVVLPSDPGTWVARLQEISKGTPEDETLFQNVLAARPLLQYAYHKVPYSDALSELLDDIQRQFSGEPKPARQSLSTASLAKAGCVPGQVESSNWNIV